MVMLATFIAVFVGLMLIGVPVAFALGSTAMIAAAVFWGLGNIPFGVLAQRVVYGVNSFTVLAVPLFLLAGQLMNAGGITRRIFRFAECLVGHLRGGLGYVNILASVIFSGMSGAAAADAAGLGTIEIQAMTEAGYDLEFSVAITGASSLIGPIIPPSVPMVMYGVLGGVSVGSLFIGGIIPGLLVALALGALVFYYAAVRDYPREPRPTLKEFINALRMAFLPLLAPVIIIGGIWTGVFTPTEAAAVTAAYALLLNLLYREMSLAVLCDVVRAVAIDSACILFIMACASAYSYVLVRTQIPMLLAESIFSITRNPLAIILLLNGFLLIVGCFVSTAVAISIFTPIFVPLIKMVGIDPLFFGVVMVLNLMIGQLTPPFGIVLFILAKISGLSMERLVKALLPFVVPVLVVLLACIFFPELVTYLPRTVLGR
jgi:tripartite ATP-independent transporter DctM subunit